MARYPNRLNTYTGKGNLSGLNRKSIDDILNNILSLPRIKKGLRKIEEIHRTNISYVISFISIKQDL